MHGVLYRVTAADMAKLSKAEGGYVEREFEVRGEEEGGLSAGGARRAVWGAPLSLFGNLFFLAGGERRRQ